MTELRTRFLLACAAAGAFVIIMALEIATEGDDIKPADIAVDGLVLLLTILSATAAVLLCLRVERQHGDVRALIAELDHARRDGEGWWAAVETHVEGLNIAIERQFDDWEMSPAERDVARLVLKGFSHKEIAALRATSERTVRQQAQSVYRKSGLAGKNGLSAYFLEDLLSPKAERDRDGHALSNGPATGVKARAAIAERPGVG
jgi:DNA-binding CsgD family transcriptional regulator